MTVTDPSLPRVCIPGIVPGECSAEECCAVPALFVHAVWSWRGVLHSTKRVRHGHPHLLVAVDASALFPFPNDVNQSMFRSALARCSAPTILSFFCICLTLRPA